MSTKIHLSPKGQNVLEDILSIGKDRSLILGKRIRVLPPSATDLFAMCELLSKNPNEESLQRFLEERVGFLLGITGTNDNSDLAVLFKPPIGTQYKADFCVLQAFQGGCVANLIEIESSHEQLFTRSGNPTQRYAHAIKQVEDWRIWIDSNIQHYSRELVRIAQSVPLLGEQDKDARGVRVCSSDKLAKIWSDFGGFQQPTFSYTIIMGRWSSLSETEKKRVIARNQLADIGFVTRTFEQVARLANFRLDVDEW